MMLQLARTLFAHLRRRLRDNRRVLAIATLLAFAAGGLMYLRYDAVVFGMPLAVFTGLTYAVVVGTAAAITLVVLPALATMIEAVALARFGVALAAAGFPDFGQALVTSPMLSATTIVLGAVVVRRLRRHIGRAPGLALPQPA
jgi:hypothetical protein